ncbi:MAG: efflux RND transporter periplasmic adaptor subunit [Gammaproteobacteria bacterium]|nr:efflux RND transporter periplasmic adaptor subunit [Gammaproteobacteria bacterium]
MRGVVTGSSAFGSGLRRFGLSVIVSIDRKVSSDRKSVRRSRSPDVNAPSLDPAQPPAAPAARRRLRLALGAGVILAAGLALWWYAGRSAGPGAIVLYGNVDLREVSLAFNDSGRIESIAVQEGDSVHRGEALAQLDTSRLLPMLAQAEARAAAERAALERLQHGSRPQEIAQARANLALARAQQRQTLAQYSRVAAVFRRSGGRAVSRQDVTDARAAAAVAAARTRVAREALHLAVLGPRREDIAQATALLAADRAAVALLRQELADATLRAPLDALVRTRIGEPGDMVSPQSPVLTLAITNPKWVRAYIPETDLARVHPGMAASVAVDGFAHRRFAGWVGFISSEAQFTPKTVQTPELRTSLVYEIRVFVKDPHDQLRLGMPATVYLAPGGSGA